jgi:hypothetical protein
MKHYAVCAVEVSKQFLIVGVLSVIIFKRTVSRDFSLLVFTNWASPLIPNLNPLDYGIDFADVSKFKKVLTLGFLKVVGFFFKIYHEQFVD